MKIALSTRPVIAGNAEGYILASKTALSFWGGVEPHSGMVVDVHHDLCGTSIAGRVLFIPTTRGSCSGSTILLEMVRANTAPAAIVTLCVEQILATGAILARALYRRTVPVFLASEEVFRQGSNALAASLSEDGTMWIEEQAE